MTDISNRERFRMNEDLSVERTLEILDAVANTGRYMGPNVARNAARWIRGVQSEESKLDRAVRLMHEAADAYDACPIPTRFVMTGRGFNVASLRAEAEWLEATGESWKEAMR